MQQDSAASGPRRLPLQDITVLDLSKVLAGPLCGQYLGELGARVIKVEPVGVGDDTRAWLPQDAGQSATFLAVNHNKQSLAVDLKTETGRAVVQRLAKEADVVLQGFGGKTALRLGVDYDTLSALNPALIYCEISGYGREGPMGEEPGYDVMLQAFSGMISTMGEPGGSFARASFSPVDLGTGSFALSGILAALLARSQTGQGQYLDVSLLDTSLGLMSYMAQNYWRTGQIPKRMGTGHPAMCPYQAFRAADGDLMLGVGNDAQWQRFCAVAGLQDYVDAPEFCSNAARVRNFDATVALVQAHIATRTVAQWIAALKPAGIACSAIHTLDQALAHPQVAARELIVTSQHPVLGEVRNVGLPIRFGKQPRQAAAPAPLLGEHSRKILADLGYSNDAIDAMLADGCVQETAAIRQRDQQEDQQGDKP